MISSYFTDLVNIAHYNYDSYGKATITHSNLIPARIEDVNKVVKNINGKEEQANILLFIKDLVQIRNIDKIIIVKKHGEAYDNDQEFEIKALEKVGMFRSSHYEVYL